MSLYFKNRLRKIIEKILAIVKHFRLIYRKKKDKFVLLKKAKEHFPDQHSLKVSERYGYYLFHNKNNSLIKRGELYEPELQQALLNLFVLNKLRNTKNIFADVGANIGLHTAFVKKFYPDMEIMAFDPSPFSAMYLDLTLQLNKITNVKFEKFALSDKNGKLDFYSFGEESSADALKNTNRVHGVKPIVIEVETKKLDEVTFGSSKPTVIKMDCEGAELNILKGAINILKQTRPLIILEIHPINKKAFHVTNEDIFFFVEEMNYILLSLKFDILDLEKFSAMQNSYEENYILLPKEMKYNNEDYAIITN